MRGRHQPLHPETRMALADLRRAGGKAILLLNRRGWSNFLSCRACGRVWLCPNCDVALVLHRHGPFVACHHCGHRERVPERCPAPARRCSVARHGAGTERIEHELREALGRGALSRSSGSTPTPPRCRQRARTLQRFQAAPAGVLVGTQMVAKGHDFPDVSLGVVLDADQTLRFPDFRAEERTFALITQLAGRTGRGALGSRVLVQTLAPDARPIRFAVHHDSDGFIADELERRRALRYPPYASLIRVVCSAEDGAAGPGDRRRRFTVSWRRWTRRCSARRRCFACAAEPAASWCQGDRAPARRSTPSAAPSTASRRARRGAGRRSASTSIPSSRPGP